MTAAATLSMAGTASASTSGDHGAKMKAQIRAWLAAHPTALKQANGHHSAVIAAGVAPDFGLGKAAIPVEAVPGTFPSSMTPVFDELNLQTTLAGPTSDGQTLPCFLMADSPPSPITTTDPDDCIIPAIPEGDTYTVAPTGFVPAGFLLPAAVTGSMSDAVAATCIGAPPVDAPQDAADIPYCTGPTVEVPGIWNQITATVTNSITGKPVQGATYALHGSADQSPPEQPTSLRATAAKTSALTSAAPVLDTATTNAAGALVFDSAYLGGDYTITPVKAPKGYQPDTADHAFTTPTVTSLAQAGQPHNSALTLTPKAPVASDDASGGAFGEKQVIHVLANDKATFGSLTLTGLTKAAHGKVHRNSNGTVTYVPAAGFTGTDTFTYTERNTLGAVSTASVTVVVHPQVQAEHEILPLTGQRTGPLVDAGLVSLAVGALLMGLGARRRRTT
ncbi:MAG: Ig-like domain-containing protein [Catenulispora sp.]